MGKIGDLFVKLGLKKDDFDKGLNGAGASLKGFAAKFGVISAAASGVFKAVSEYAVKMAQDFVRHSQKIGDAWDQTMSRAKAAWGQFLTALTSWDWDNFGSKMRNAMDAAAASTRAHDAEFEVMNSIKLKRAEMQEELSILEIEMRNQKNSYDERARYAQQYLDKVRPLYEQEKQLRKNLMETDMTEYLSVLGLSNTQQNRANVYDFLKNIAPNPSAVNALAKQGGGKYDVEGSMADIAARYQNNGNESAQKVVDAILGYYDSTAKFNEETRRVQQILNSAETRINTDAINTAERADERLRAQAEKIAQRAENSQKTEVQLLQEKYAEEKALLEQYGYDTEKLTKEHYDNLFEILNDGLDREINELLNIEPVELDLFDIDTRDADAIMNKFIQDLEDATERAKELAEEFRDAIIEGFSAGCQELMDQFMGVSELNGGAVLQAVLRPLADMAIKTGEVIMAQGVAVEAAKTSLVTLGGVGAIAAGAALIAAGSALKSGLSRIAKGGAAGTSTTTAADSSTGGRGFEANTEITVHVEGMIKGGDIVLAGSKTQNAWGR